MEMFPDQKLFVLMLEDVSTDAELIKRELVKGNISFVELRVKTRDEFIEALEISKPELILADYSLPSFDGISALRIAQNKYPDVPFIFVTGAMGEEWAIETFKSGATDYVLKDRLSRLVPAVIRALREVQERKKREESEKALRESEAKYRHFIQNFKDAIYVIYKNNFEIINNKFQDTFNISLDDANKPGFDLIKLVAPINNSYIKDQLKVINQNEQADQIFEFTALTGKRQEINVELSISHIRYKDGIAIQGIIRDITEHKRLEAQLLHSQKIDALGRFAGGIAHDFNNILTAITGYSDILLTKIKESDPIYSDISEIQKASERASVLTRQLLAFSRKQVLQISIINLNKVITGIEKMLRRLIGEDVEVQSVLDPNLGLVKADQGQIEQVIINLAVNARDAMPDGGKIIIKTKNLYLDDHSVKPGHYSMMSMSDTGIGMNKETISKAFDPFFTTKEVGKGTGLGLSTVHGIITQSGGYICADSEPGCGTTFNIYLPNVEEKETPKTQQPLTNESFKGTQTVLLVEDDDGVRNFAQTILLMFGYNVLLVQNPEEALITCKNDPSIIHLLITDIVMPQMNGFDLAQKIRSLRPDIKILFMSGYTETIISKQQINEKDALFIQKPFTYKSLLSKIKTIFNSNEK